MWAHLHQLGPGFEEGSESQVKSCTLETLLIICKVYRRTGFYLFSFLLSRSRIDCLLSHNFYSQSWNTFEAIFILVHNIEYNIKDCNKV